MKKKRIQQWIAMLLSVALLAGTMETTGFAQSLNQDDPVRENQEEAQAISEEVWNLVNATTYTQEVKTAEDAQGVRASSESDNLLVTAADSTLSGITAGTVASAGTGKFGLFDSSLKELDVYNTKIVELKGVELECLKVYAEEGENVSLRIDDQTSIPEVILTGNGKVVIEGSGAFGMIHAKDPLSQLTIRATGSVKNESEKPIPLEEPDGNSGDLMPAEQKELVLTGYLIRFMADGEELETKVEEPGAVIEFPQSVPEKEGYIFTSWYKDEGFTETASQFEVADGQTDYYARYISQEEAVTVHFDTQGGTTLAPITMAKGESLLSRPVEEIYTSQEGYTFGGWCVDPECTEAFAYSQPVEDNLTLYAFFISDEVQQEEKEGNTAELTDFEWNGKIPLTVKEGMTPEEIKADVTVEAGAGEAAPEIKITEEDGKYFLSGNNYEKDRETGFEPGSTFSLLADGDVHFADYSDEITTLVVAVYKEQIENVVFADDMTYVLWDDVISYVPAQESEEGQTEDAKIDAEQAETDQSVDNQTDAEQAETDQSVDNQTDAEQAEADQSADDQVDAAQTEETKSEDTSQDDSAALDSQSAASTPETDETGDETGSEWEMPAYIPGEIVVKGDGDYKEGDLVAFYDGEIGRDEKTMDSYTDGSFDGYVLYAKVVNAEPAEEGTKITFQYASPEEYLSDFDVHMTEDADLEQELTQEDLEVLTSRLTRQVEENEELKAQLLVSVMSSQETQDLLNEKYGDGVYSLAAMSARLKLNKPSVSLSVSGSAVTAEISVSAVATISKDGQTLMTIEPKLSFTQTLEVRMNVNGGKFWIDMSVSFLSTTKIALTISATSGGDVSVFEDAKETLEELVKPEGIEGSYEEYDKSVQDLMDTMTSIVQTSLDYNDLFDITLLNLRYSFYGIITIGVEVHFVGQIGVLATFGIEIVAKSGERIGFNYNFLKFKGKSYTEKLDSSVTNNIYLIGKVGVRVGVRLILSVTICGIVQTSITGSLYLYAELTGVFFFTANLLTGANSSLGALHFEVGIDVVVTLTLKVKLIFKTIRKDWTVYTGRWPLWSKSVSSKLSYVDEAKLDKAWEPQAENADHRSMFGFTTIPMKTWDLMGGKCTENALLSGKAAGKGGNVKITIENLVVNGEAVSAGDPKENLFTVGDASKGQNPVAIYMDENLAAEQLCEEAELDMVFTYENNSSSALVKKQVKRFHLKKKCSIASTTQNVKVVLYDWCARNWDLEPASWDGAEVYSTSFVSSRMLGLGYEPTATGTLDLGAIVTAAQTAYPELTSYSYGWAEPNGDGTRAGIQYSVPRYSDFCYMTTENGVVRYDVRANTEVYDATYYLYVNRFEGYEDSVRYHIRLDGAREEDSYEFTTRLTENGEEKTFTRQEDGTYLLETRRKDCDTTEQPILMSVNKKAAVKTGFVITGREVQQDVYFDIKIGNGTLGIQLGEGVESYEFEDSDLLASSEGIRPGTLISLKVNLKEGYGGLEAVSENKNAEFTIKDNVVSFVMPTESLSVTLQAYRLHTITYLYQYKGYGTYQTAYFAENEKTTEAQQPVIQGLTFRGWYTTSDFSGEPYTFGDTLKTDVTLYADWTCDVTVHFTPAKGTASYWQGTDADRQEIYLFEDKDQTYYQFTYSILRPEEKLLDIQVPEYEGYQFMGWYADPECSTQAIDLETYKVSGGMDIYAGWAKIVDILFDKNDGSADTLHAQTTGLVGYPLGLLPEEPTRQYYSFTGWYKNAAATVPADIENEKITGKTTYYAGWKADSYSITYELGGGTNSEANPAAYTTEDSFTLSDPVREGYEFDGWIGTDIQEATREVTVEKGNGGERTYTAVWSPIVYSIEYRRTFGTAENNPQTYTIEDEILLEQPTREKYQFEGWIGTDLEEPTKEVSIPKGSIGDRIYTATWSTEDQILDILERVEVLANEHPYNDDLIAFLTQEDFMTDEINYEALEEKLAAAVERYLMAMIMDDEKIGAYSDHIQLTVSFDKEFTDLYGDSKMQRHGFRIAAVYVDDDGKSTPEEPNAFSYFATLNKMEPTSVSWPEASKLLYGETVGDSELGEGSAQYINEDFALEYPVIGSFDWKAEEKGKVPFGRNNGTEDSSYQVVFTPYQEDRFTPVEGSVGVLTQIGLTVICSADDRDYIPEDTSATGSAKLVYVDQAGNLTDTVFEDDTLLTGGTWSFANDKAEVDKQVTFTGYSLDAAKNTTAKYGENAYVLVGEATKTCQATIHPVEKGNERIQILAPKTIEDQYLYGTPLGDMQLTNGSVQYQKKNGNYITVEGRWDWKNAEKESIPNAGTSSYTAVFTPNDKYEGGYGSFEATVEVTVQKQTVTVPQISDLTYVGTAQAPQVAASNLYQVKENTAKTSVGTYTVKLELKDFTNYMWADSTSEKVTIQDAEAMISYQILPAEITVDTAAASTTQVLYGQKLTSEAADQISTVNGQKNITTALTAKGKVSGTKATYKGASGENRDVAGTWSWITDSDGNLMVNTSGKEVATAQPLVPSDTAYQVNARFTPNDKNLKEYEAYLPVKVGKSDPYVPYTLSTDSFYLGKGNSGFYYTPNGVKINEKEQPVYNRYTGEQITGTWEWDDPSKQETESKEFGAKFVFSNSKYDPLYTMPRQNCTITVRDYILVTLKINVASENLKLTGSDIGNKSKFGLKGGVASYTVKKNLQQGSTDGSNGRVEFDVDCWQNLRDDENVVVPKTRMVIKTASASGKMMASGTFGTERYVNIQAITSPYVGDSDDMYVVTVDLNSNAPHGDVSISLTVDAVEPTYKVQSQAVQSASKSKKAAKKANVQLTPTPTVTPVPETDLITPTPAETPDGTITTPTPSETPDITVTPPAPSETPEPVTPTVTPPETPEPSTPPDTPAETPTETPQPTPAESTEVETPEVLPTETPQTESQDSSSESPQSETTADTPSPQSELSETVPQAA